MTAIICVRNLHINMNKGFVEYIQMKGFPYFES